MKKPYNSTGKSLFELIYDRISYELFGDNWSFRI